MIARLLRIAGTLLLASGLLFLLQGAGIVHWPADSFMLDQRVWIWYGAGIAVIGAAALVLSRRI